eukprot:6190214-Pleurochrysis_carterae.AAC.2
MQFLQKCKNKNLELLICGTHVLPKAVQATAGNSPSYIHSREMKYGNRLSAHFSRETAWAAPRAREAPRRRRRATSRCNATTTADNTASPTPTPGTAAPTVPPQEIRAACGKVANDAPGFVLGFEEYILPLSCCDCPVEAMCTFDAQGMVHATWFQQGTGNGVEPKRHLL